MYQTNVNQGKLWIPIRLPYGLVSQTIYVDLVIVPGAIRTGSNRVLVSAYKKEYSPFIISSPALATQYDDGTSDLQIITISFSVTTSDAGEYFLIVTGGNDAGTNKDDWAGGRVRL